MATQAAPAATAPPPTRPPADDTDATALGDEYTVWDDGFWGHGSDPRYAHTGSDPTVQPTIDVSKPPNLTSFSTESLRRFLRDEAHYRAELRSMDRAPRPFF